MVEGKYPDINSRSLEATFHLDADKAFNHQLWAPPIHWRGTVGGVKVRFTQISDRSSGTDDFDFDEFPLELETAKSHIIQAINMAMKVMD